jgi:hypothetical protein
MKSFPISSLAPQSRGTNDPRSTGAAAASNSKPSAPILNDRRSTR